MQFPSLFCAASYYASFGAPVFPCEPNGKRPLGALAPHGCKDATDNVDQVEQWWRDCPQANIGIRSGNGIFVLDVDGELGKQTLADLQQQYGLLPATVTSVTGSGGWHIFYRTPPDREIRNSASKLGPKLDVRGDGGYVIAPPSIHPNGNCYAFVPGCEPWSKALAQSPNWLLDLLTQPISRDTSRPAPPFDFAPGLMVGAVSSAYVAGAVRRARKNVACAPEGRRNDTLNIETLSLSRFVHTGQLGLLEIIAYLTDAAHSAGLSKQETERTIHSALKAGLAQNGQMCHG